MNIIIKLDIMGTPTHYEDKPAKGAQTLYIKPILKHN